MTLCVKCGKELSLDSRAYKITFAYMTHDPRNDLSGTNTETMFLCPECEAHRICVMDWVMHAPNEGVAYLGSMMAKYEKGERVE